MTRKPLYEQAWMEVLRELKRAPKTSICKPNFRSIYKRCDGHLGYVTRVLGFLWLWKIKEAQARIFETLIN